MLKKIGIGLAALVATVPGIYLLFIRPWHQRWGATDEEIQRPMPGDDEVKNPMMSATHAVTINARPQEVWPWLVQLGQGRGGFYTYEWIENRMGLGIRKMLLGIKQRAERVTAQTSEPAQAKPVVKGPQAK